VEEHPLAGRTKGQLRSRFAAVRVRPAHRDEQRTDPRPEEWLLIEWRRRGRTTKYWLSTLPVETKIPDPARLAKLRWLIERDYEELKQELGWGISRDEVGAGFIIMPPYASRRMGSWWPSGAFFPPPPIRSAGIILAPNPAAFPAARAARPQRAAQSVVNRNIAHDDPANSAARLKVVPTVARHFYNIVY